MRLYYSGVALLLGFGCASESIGPSASDSVPSPKRDAVDDDAETDAAIDGEPDNGLLDGAFSVRHYDYRFNLLTRSATTRLHLEIEEGKDCISIPMRTHPPLWVSSNDKPLDWSLDNGQLRICGAALQREGLAQVEVHDFEVPLDTLRGTQVGYSERTTGPAGQFHYGQSWVGQCDRLGPCDHDPATFATYRIEVEHEPESQVLCPGTITTTESSTTCTFDFDGGPTYSTFAFAVSDRWVKHDLGLWGDVRVTLYDLPGSDLVDELDVELHAAFLTWMEERFGPYPYGDELRIFAAPLSWAGFEHPGNIVLSHSLRGVRATSTMHHELAHMWAGNQTTLATVHDFVWKEAMAEYLPFVFAEERAEGTSAVNSAASWRGGGMATSSYPVPLEEPELVDYYGRVYSAGPMILFRQTEALFGREAILEGIGQVLGEPRTLSVDELREALETSTGADLRGYFERWVFGTGRPPRPHFDIDIRNRDDGVKLRVDQRDPDEGLFGCAFTLRLEGETGEPDDVRIDLGPDGRARTELLLERIEPVVGVRFDPESECMANHSIHIESE